MNRLREKFRDHYRPPAPTSDVTHEWQVQIKGRAVGSNDRYRGRRSSIVGEEFDGVALVLLDRASYDAPGIREAPRDGVSARLTEPGGRARTEHRSLAVSQVKSVAQRVWPAADLR